LEFVIVVVPEFASVVEFEPRTFRALALSVESVSEQAAYAPLPTAKKIRGERGDQFLKRRHFCWFLKLQETLDFDFNVHSIIGIGLKSKMLIKLQKTTKYLTFLCRDVIELMISRPRSNPLKKLLITVMSRHSTGRGRSRVVKLKNKTI
jgi:hypothetical protein